MFVTSELNWRSMLNVHVFIQRRFIFLSFGLSVDNGVRIKKQSDHLGLFRRKLGTRLNSKYATYWSYI